MKCPKCGGDTTVFNTRPRPNNTVWRRRKCLDCDERTTTREMEDGKITAIIVGAVKKVLDS